jgi:PIN domain nuclease of toxin-antitoxin system
MLCAPENQVYLSAASAWEITIKYGLGKLALPEPPERFLTSRLTALGHTVLPVELAHVLRLVELPDLHRDPFDRMLVAQALAEDMDLVTADQRVAGYAARVVWAG